MEPAPVNEAVGVLKSLAPPSAFEPEGAAVVGVVALAVVAVVDLTVVPVVDLTVVAVVLPAVVVVAPAIVVEVVDEDVVLVAAADLWCLFLPLAVGVDNPRGRDETAGHDHGHDDPPLGGEPGLHVSYLWGD